MGKFDEIFDDVVVNAKAAASAVSKKATGVYDSSKQKIAAAEIRSDINKKLRELGVLTYKANTQNSDVAEEAALIIDEITDLKESLNAINEKLDSAKKQIRCSECNAVVPKNSIFCNVCGKKITVDNVSEESVEDEKSEQEGQTSDNFENNAEVTAE